MKNIFRTILNGNSLKNKKLLLAAVLSSVTINCDATLQKINNPNKTEDKRIFYQIQKKVAGEEYVEAMSRLEAFDTLSSWIQQVWENREKNDFAELIDLRFIQVQWPRLDVTLKTGLCCMYDAWWCFQTQKPITMKKVKETIKRFSNRLDWKEDSRLLEYLTFYLFGKTWRGAFWMDAINRLEEAEDKKDVIRSLQEKFNKINDTKLNKLFLQIVSIYLETRYDFMEFKMINKKCRDAVDGLHFNPLPIGHFSSDWLNSGRFWDMLSCLRFEQDFRLIRSDRCKLFFPNIKTQ